MREAVRTRLGELLPSPFVGRKEAREERLKDLVWVLGVCFIEGAEWVGVAVLIERIAWCARSSVGWVRRVEVSARPCGRRVRIGRMV